MTAATQTADGACVLSDEQSQFVEQFALAWDAMGNGRMEGRIVGLLMILDVPFLSSRQIGQLLSASAGAVSIASRRLIDSGFIHRHVVPGDRRHYFAVEDDIWGGFLKTEHSYLRRLSDVIEAGEHLIAADAASPRRRVANSKNYLVWLEGYHKKMLADWIEFRDARAPEDDDV